MNNASKLKAYRWLIWVVLVGIYLVVFFQRLSVGAIKGDLESTFGMSAAQIANLGSMYFYAYAAMQIPTGMLVDKLGPRFTVVGGASLAGIASILFSYSANLPMAYASRLLIGVGVSVVFLSILKILDNWFPAKDFATMSGLTIFVGSMGGLLTQAPLVIVVGIIGWRSTFLSMGFITLALAVLALIFAKDSPVQIGLPEVNPKHENFEKETLGPDKILTQLLNIIRNPRIWGPSFVIGGIYGGVIIFSGTFGIAYLGYTYGLDKITASNIISVYLLSSAFCNVGLGFVSDRLKIRKSPMVILALINLAIWILLLLFEPPIWYLYLFSVVEGACGAVGVISFVIAKEVSNPRYSGMATSIVNFTTFASAGILPVICGVIIDTEMAAGATPVDAYQKGFMVCIASGVLALIFSFFMKETRCENVFYKNRTGGTKYENSH